MAPLNMCFKTAALQSLVFENQVERARLEAIALLNEGYNHPQFLKFVASLLETKTRNRGAPSRPPVNWYAIGSECESLYSSGMSKEDIRHEVSKKYGGSESTIKRAWKFYCDAKQEHDSIE